MTSPANDQHLGHDPEEIKKTTGSSAAPLPLSSMQKTSAQSAKTTKPPEEMKQLRKTYIQLFYNAIKAYYNSEAKYERLTPIQKIKFFRRLRKEAKQASEKFDMEIQWFMECLEGNDYTILMDMMLILCYFNVPIENVYKILGTIGFELVD